RLQERVDGCWIRCRRTERDVVIGNASRLRSGDVRLDVSPLLGRETEIDDRCVTHLLDFRDRGGRNGARARHGRLGLGEVPDAGNLLPYHLCTRRGRDQARDAEQRQPPNHRLHAAPPLNKDAAYAAPVCSARGTFGAAACYFSMSSWSLADGDGFLFR